MLAAPLLDSSSGCACTAISRRAAGGGAAGTTARRDPGAAPRSEPRSELAAGNEYPSVTLSRMVQRAYRKKFSMRAAGLAVSGPGPGSYCAGQQAGLRAAFPRFGGDRIVALCRPRPLTRCDTLAEPC